MKVILETKRLILREMNLDDFESLKKVISDPLNMQYYPKPYDDNGVLRWINWCMNSYKENNFGLWAVVYKETNEMIGDCGISLQNIDNELKPEIGYHLRLDYHCQGIRHEMTSAVKDYFFKNYNYNEVYSYMNINNIPSEKTAIKNGMKFIKTFKADDGEIDKVYRITRSEWESAPKKHYMKLWNDSFVAIKSGYKTIEMRLNDEKRKSISIEDEIEFVNTKTNESLNCKVVNLYHYKNFEELYAYHDKLSIGYLSDEIANPDDMLMYYTKEDIEKYGVLGIEIRKKEN